MHLDKPSEKYWEILADKRHSALAGLFFVMKQSPWQLFQLHKEVKELKEAMKALENKNSDAEYFAMMYSMTKPITSATN